MKIYIVMFIVLSLSGCQTADFGLKTREQIEDHAKKDEVQAPAETTEESLNDKKVNRNKLFNTSTDQEQIRPKVGLILGPGLSFSMAHLGVLKAVNDQKIPIQSVAGMGWSSLIAANYAINGAVNDMRWKAFQGSFANAVSTSFLGGSIKETGDNVYGSLINQYTRGRSLAQSKIPFLCPALQVRKGRAVIIKSGSYAQALKSCMKVPPLAQTESSTWAYLLEIKELVFQMKRLGAQKIIFVNVLPRAGMNWGKQASAIDARDQLFWAQVIQGLKPQDMGADHVLTLSMNGHLALDFKNVKRMIEVSESKAQDYFAKFARKYSF